MGVSTRAAIREADTDVRSLAMDCPDGFTIAEHTHPWGQLVFGVSGVMRVVVRSGVWFVPPSRAIWLPPDRPHSIVMQGDVAMRTLYLAPERRVDPASEAVVLEVSPLLRELILHIHHIGPLERHNAAHNHLAAVLTQLISDAPVGDLHLPLPRDPRARMAAEWLQRHPAERAALAEVAGRAGASLRTLQRIFSRETGLSMGAWALKARLIHAVAHLSGGASVTEAGLACGYESTSAFISAFRRQFGVTPRRYAESGTGGLRAPRRNRKGCSPGAAGSPPDSR